MEAAQNIARTLSDLRPGDHLCCIYDGERMYRQALASFLADGLRLAQKAVFLFPNHDPRPVIGWLSRTGADVDLLLASGWLVLRDSAEIYGTPANFDPDRAFGRLHALFEQVQAGDSATVRLAVDMRWTRSAIPSSDSEESALQSSVPLHERLAAFERLLNAPGRFPTAMLLCLYDGRGQPQVMYKEALAAHSGVFDGSQHSDLARLLSTSSLGAVGPEIALAQAHAALAETESRYRTIFNAANEAIIIYDLEGCIIDVNRVAYERLGYTRSGMVGQFADFVEAPELSGQFPVRADLVRRYGTITYETVHVTRSGELFPVEVNARLIDYDSRPVMLSIARDITDRKHAELALVNVNQALASANSALKTTNAALRESEQKFRSLVESSPDGVALVDTSGRLIEFNSAQENIFGLPAADVLGHKLVDEFFKLLPGHSGDLNKRQTFETAIAEALATGKADWLTRLHEHEILRPDGQRRFAQSTTFPIITQSGYMIGVITRDVTAHRLAELELEQYRQQLEQMVADRTAQLRREIRERLQVEENLEVMLREVHHRVKNNLNVIIALIELQKGIQTDPRVLAVFQDLQNRAYSMALVHESLYRSPNLAQVDFSNYLRTLADFLQAAYVPTCCGAPVALRVEADHVSLRIETAVPCGLMVSELVTNAMKYAFAAGFAPGGHDPCTDSRETLGEISVRLERGESPSAQQQFVLTVQDNGVGFPAGFDWQSASTLGLQLVRVLARQLGGALSLDTTKGITWRFAFEERK